jgi:peptidoglycan/xylan/chitin deacetylase (PgdA/CDA1 family)
MGAIGGGDLIILCYHAVSDTWPSVGAIETRQLNRQIGSLLRRGYRPLTLSAALAADPGERRLAVTFDDAFQSVIERGLPVLERLGVPATLFVPTDFANEAAPMTWSTLSRWVGTSHEDELRCMSWDGVRSLAVLGWEIGSHTCSHPALAAVERADAEIELRRSKEVCEAELGLACRSLAYPFGSYDATVVELAREAGYASAVTLGERLLEARCRSRPLELSREGIYRSTRWPHFRVATSRTLGYLRASRVYRRLAPA